ncbi:MAG: hypothetical protein RLO50_18370 [Azospirillaceae bacterium]
MSLTRRTTLALLGGGVIVAADLLRARRVLAQSGGDPTAPWFSAGTGETEPRRRALAYAILAPNPHNRQPWQVALEGDDTLVLTCDPGRRLPETDPFDRQITIGLGCFTELLALAAAEQGLAAEITPFPEGEPAPRLDGRPVARIRFVPGGAADPLFRHVLDRRSNKAPYAMDRPVAPESIGLIAGAAIHGTAIDGSVAADRVAAIRELAINGMALEMKTPETAMESVDLLRIGEAAVTANPDGIDLTGPMIEDLAQRGILTRDALAAEVESGNQGPLYGQMMHFTIEPMHATPAYLWQTSASNTRREQFDAGRDYVRLNLAATGLGLALHPQSQTLQEFAAMAPLRAEMAALLAGGSGRTVQMLCRLGYGPEVPPSPRWPAETRIITA